jgi:hypothetical protein
MGAIIQVAARLHTPYEKGALNGGRGQCKDPNPSLVLALHGMLKFGYLSFDLCI